jgi:hypothetical protein
MNPFRFTIFFPLNALYIVLAGSIARPNAIFELFASRNQTDDIMPVATQIATLIVPVCNLPPLDLLQLLSGTSLDFSIFFWKIKNSLELNEQNQLSYDPPYVVWHGLMLLDSPLAFNEYLRQCKRALENYIKENNLEIDCDWCNYYGTVITHIIYHGIFDDLKVCVGKFNSN